MERIEYQVTSWLKGHCVGCHEDSAESEAEISAWFKMIVEEIPYSTEFDRVYISSVYHGLSWDSFNGDYVEINDNR